MSNIPVGVLDGFYLKDDFYSNDSLTDANVGELLWEIATIVNASTYAYIDSEPADDAYGILRSTTAAVAVGDGSVLRLVEGRLSIGAGEGSIKFKARYPNVTGNALAGNNVRAGLQDSVTATASVAGVYIESDAGVISLVIRSTNGDESAAAADVSTLTGGTTMVLDEWHLFEIRWSGENANGGPDTVQLFVDGELAAELDGVVLLGDTEDVELSMTHWQDSGSADSLELDIDFIECYIARANK